MYENLAFWAEILALLFAVAAFIFEQIAQNQKTPEEIENEQRIADANTPFEKKKGKIDVTVFNYDNWGNNSNQNLARVSYEDLQNIDLNQFENDLELKFYNIIEGAEAKKEFVTNKIEELKADLGIYGIYDSNYAEYNFIELQINGTYIGSRNEIKFESIARAISNKTINEPIRTKVEELLIAIDKYWFTDFNTFTDTELFLFEQLIEKDEDDMAMETLSIHKTFTDPNIVSDENYGLKKELAIYGGYHEALYSKYLNLLTYKGKSVIANKTDEILVKFDQEMTETGNETWVNVFEITDPDGNSLDTVYVFEKSYEANLRPPKGFDFPYQILER